MRLYSPDGSRAAAADLAACRAILRQGSRSFLAASLLLPRRVRDPATALYAFCRLADDDFDLPGRSDGALADWRGRLTLAFQGRPADSPVDRAFARVVEQFAIPAVLPEALLEGFEWDAEGRHYATLDELHAYGVRVAGSVGAMMAILMGARDEEALARACDLGVAMQLSNIVRDVGEDAQRGRIYLPLDWMRESGLDPESWLARPTANAALRAVVARLLDAAESLYRRADQGISRLPADCRSGIRAARLIYAEIGREVERSDLDSVSRRAVVTGSRKAVLISTALFGSQRGATSAPVAALPEARYLVQAVDSGARDVRPGGPRWLRVLELFERLEQRDRMARASFYAARRT